MDGRGLAAVALRIWGVVLLLGAVAAIPGSILAARAAASQPARAEFVRAAHNASMFHPGASVILGLCLPLWADGVARWAIPETPPVQIAVGTSQLLTVGLVLVGVGLLVQGLEESASLGYALMRKPQGVEIGAASYLWDWQSETMVKAGVDVVAGATLVLGRTGLARAWAQVRSLERGTG